MGVCIYQTISLFIVYKLCLKNIKNNKTVHHLYDSTILFLDVYPRKVHV